MSKGPLESRKILCLSNPNWEGDYAKSTVELMKILAKDSEIIFVENAITLKEISQELLTLKFDLLLRALGVKSRIKKVILEMATVWILKPGPNLSINFLPKGVFYRFFLKLNNLISYSQIKKALRKLCFQDDYVCLVAFNPHVGVDLLRWLKPKRKVYYCYDDISSAQYLAKHGSYLEKELLDQVDTIIVSSEALKEKKSQQSQKPIFLVKNAVNFKLFNAVFSETPPQKRTVGFLGSIDDRMDIDLLEFLVQKHAEIDFEFIGRLVYEEVKLRLEKYPNVIFVPGQALEKVMDRIQNFSVGIIPYVKNDFTSFIYPLKINEYLAVGLPVVMTDFTVIDEFHEVVFLANSPGNFSDKLILAMESDSPNLRKERNDFARMNTWEERKKDFETILFG